MTSSQSITMKPILKLILASACILYKGAFSQSIRSDFILLKQPYTFPGDTSGCHHAEWRKRSLTDTTIATYTNYVCTTGKGFEEEVTCKDNHLRLKSAKYTDQGAYEFICDGVKTPVNLDVLYALKQSAEEMDNVTLSCYANSAKDVKWLHNNDSVLYYKTDGSVTPGKGYETRASLENNCFKTGDLSLTITNIHMEDAGIYRCFVHDETVKGNPHAYVLRVSEKSSGPGDQTQPSCNQTILITLTVVFAFISVTSVTYLITTRQCTSTTASQSSEDELTETDRMLMPAISLTTPTTESQSVDPRPVQESDSVGNKPSSTRPII